MGDDTSNLSLLGSEHTSYEYDGPEATQLETFPNKTPDRDYLIKMEFPEFTSLCPKTGQPDFATIHLEYIAQEKCLESKSIKLYFFRYRGYGSFMETIVNKILDDFVEACSPKQMKVTGIFNPRGGLKIEVVAKYSITK